MSRTWPRHPCAVPRPCPVVSPKIAGRLRHRHARISVRCATPFLSVEFAFERKPGIPAAARNRFPGCRRGMRTNPVRRRSGRDRRRWAIVGPLPSPGATGIGFPREQVCAIARCAERNRAAPLRDRERRITSISDISASQPGEVSLTL